MGYVEDLLASNEQVVYTSRKHWIAPLFATVAGTLLTLGGLVAISLAFFIDATWLMNLVRWGGGLALLVGVVLLIRAFVNWWSEHYLVTNQKVLKVSGILRKSVEGSALEKINDSAISQSLLGRWLDYGTLSVMTASDESNLHYTNMRNPVAFRRAILDQKQVFEQQDARAIADAVKKAQMQAMTVQTPAVPATAEDIAAAIERLAQMRDAGHITPAEFEAKKAELLGRL